ncbi:MAG: PLP-dependent aminotransferase family protein [Oscillospiraceae bacterium]|nr:PLP-dependent aminotransferase family protein [Oscillospiraceae bacterium]
MLTYQLKKAPGVPLYEALYRCIRSDILSGKLKANQKLPSKRALCANLKVSKITVEAAYNQLLSEGYIRSVEKVGYFVETVTEFAPQLPQKTTLSPATGSDRIDLTANGSIHFPFSVWSKLQREVVLDLGKKLLLPLPNQGLLELRQAISLHLSQFRGMQADPENILIGAGTDFLYNLLVQLLGRDKTYAVEEPGYGKIRKIYGAAGAKCISAPMDSMGVLPDLDAQVLHISPSHHFPTGLITPFFRRQALLSWAKQADNRYIIEDDYDSEFRFFAHPLPSMQSMDGGERVIYMNTFSKTLSPSIRISYMVLPRDLMAEFQQKLGFYSCTVPSFEQYSLAKFIEQGYFEKHLNRMRKFYKLRRNRVLSALENCPISKDLTVLEADAGLHFLVKVNTDMSDADLIQQWNNAGFKVQTLGQFYHGPVPASAKHQLVINYSALTDEALTQLEEKLSQMPAK